jgi:ABC-2 type transport system permease protein
MEKIKTIIAKEWAEVFRNRLVLFTVAFLPLIFVAMPLATLIAMNSVAGSDALGATAGVVDDNAEIMAFFGEQCRGLSEYDCTLVYTLNLFTLMFMILPVAIPVTIAAYSIVGEKTTHSLEPLLATPITTIELLVGKALAAIVPAILATWMAFGLYLLSARFMTTVEIFARLADPMWLIAIFVVGPLLTLLAVSFAIMVSSRVTDPRVAEQISTVVILPLILLLIGQSVGFILLSRELVLIIAGVLVLVDGLLLFFTVRLFERENILTRWKV